MSYAAQVDGNQAEAAKLCREQGWSVEYLHAHGRGVPDLLIGAEGFNFLLEMIGPAKLKKYRATGGLNERQVKWHGAWKGQKLVASNPTLAVMEIDEKARRLRALVEGLQL